MSAASLARYRRELSVVAAFAALLVLVAVVAPAFYSVGNARDLLVSNAIILLPAIGMTMVLLTREIDISIGSQLALIALVCGWLAKAGLPTPLLLLVGPACGALLGGLNGWLVTVCRIPSIIVTLATMVGWRAAIRWSTEGAWVRDLPAGFQWLGLGQAGGTAVLLLLTTLVFALAVWALAQVAAGRALYAVGSDPESARLVGLPPGRVVTGAFVVLGALGGLAAVLNATRFQAVQPNAGLGLEMRVIAAVVVGGTSVLGGRGGLWGTLAGVALLGTVGTVLTFLHVNPAWERALQGALILAAVALDAVSGRKEAGRDE